MPDKFKVVQIFKTLDSINGLELLTIIVAAALLITAVQHSLTWIGNKLQGKKRLTLLAMVPFIRLLIILTAFALIVPQLIEPSLQNMVAVLGMVGLALGFALKDYVSSLIAGVVAIGERNYRNGDWVSVGSVYGEVRHIGMRAFELVTPDDDRVLIPHSCLWNQPISNSNNGNARLQCCADFYLHPQHDGTKVREVLEDIALTSPYLFFDDPIAIIICEKPWGTHYRLKAYPVDAAQQFRFSSDLTVRGKAMLNELGLQFAIAPTVAD